MNFGTDQHATSAPDHEQGFVLATSLAILSLMTILSIGLYYRGVLNQQESASDKGAVQAFYYAETALNYVGWALTSKNDSEMDGYEPNSIPPQSVGSGPAATNTSGDFSELGMNSFNPGPISLTGTEGMVRYIDNRPRASRSLLYDTVTALNPDMATLSRNLPRHLMLVIDATGAITVSLQAKSARDPPGTTPPTPEPGTTPTNGAVVWLTPVLQMGSVNPSGSTFTTALKNNQDVSLSYQPAAVPPVVTCNGAPAFTVATTPMACICSNETTTPHSDCLWFDSYGVAGYAIGYVNGQPRTLLRSVVFGVP